MSAKNFNISLQEKDETVNDPLAGFYTHYLLIANGFVLAHFTHENGRSAYKKYLMTEGFQGFPENIMNALFLYSDPVRLGLKSKQKFIQAEQSGFSPSQHEKFVVPFRNYKIEICIYENLVFDLEIKPYVQYVVTGNDFVIASFTHLIGAVAYVTYLRKNGFKTFPKDILDVIHFYADPKKRLKNVRKEIR